MTDEPMSRREAWAWLFFTLIGFQIIQWLDAGPECAGSFTRSLRARLGTCRRQRAKGVTGPQQRGWPKREFRPFSHAKKATVYSR